MRTRLITTPGALALVLAVLAPPVRADGFVWVTTKGNSIVPGPEYGRALYAVNPDGVGGLQPLWEPTDLPAGVVFGMMDIRGDQVVFDDWEPPIGGTMYLGTVGSNKVTDIGHPGGYLDSNPSWPNWIPGEDRILFSNHGSGIHKMDADPATNDERVLTTNYFDEIEDIRSDKPEAIFSNAMHRPGARIFTTDLDGGNIIGHDPFSDASYARCPVLSPDNSMVLVTRTDHLGAWLVNADTWELISPLNEPLIPGLSDRGENNGWFAWSPNSRTIAYVDDRNLYSINIDGSDHRLLASGVEGVYGTYVPEPSAFVLLGLGALVFLRHR